MTNANTVTADQLEALDSDESGFESVQPIYRKAGVSLLKGDVVLGSFIKSEPNKFNGSNYYLRTAAGVEVLNGCGSLDKQMESAGAKAGDTLRITYDGQVSITKGPMAGKNAHQYNVAIKRQR